MKSRISWLTEGDGNTSFFHTVALVKRKRNKIVKLKDDFDNEIQGEDSITHINWFFAGLYSSDLIFCDLNPPKPVFINPLFDASAHESLISIPDVEEIKKALWDMKPFKDPGPDGLHAGFFEHCCEEVHPSLCKDIQAIFHSGCMPSSWKSFLITLVPKTSNPESIRLFRPISLGKTCYKLVTKIVVKRIKSFLNDFISPVQGAFLSGSRSADDIILAQEVLHSAITIKAKDGWMVI